MTTTDKITNLWDSYEGKTITVTLNGVDLSGANWTLGEVQEFVLTYAEVESMRDYLKRQFPSEATRITIESRFNVLDTLHGYYGLAQYAADRL